MANPIEPQLPRLVALMVKPLVRFALRKRVTFQSFNAIIRNAFVEVARSELEAAGQKVNASRISIMTGLPRQEIQKIESAVLGDYEEEEGLVGRIVSYWENSEQFKTARGPRPLTYEGDQSEFWSLCRRVNKNLHPGTVLFELERLGNIEKTDGKVFLRRANVAVRKNEERAYSLLAHDLNALIISVEKNLHTDNVQEQVLHYHTEYDQIRGSKVGEIRRWLRDQGREFHRKVREYLSAFDMDVNPESSDADESPFKVIVGSFGVDLSTSPLESEPPVR
jgi:hypothetical protein